MSQKSDLSYIYNHLLYNMIYEVIKLVVSNSKAYYWSEHLNRK